MFASLLRIKNKKDLGWRVEEGLVAEYVSAFPRCSRNVVIASPSYEAKHCTCEVVVSTTDLRNWAEKHSLSVVSRSRDSQLARQALPVWLQSADLTDNQLSYLPGLLSNVLVDYVQQFLVEGKARVFCFECGSFVLETVINEKDRPLVRGWNSWTDHWECLEGHQLYHKKETAHICMRT